MTLDAASALPLLLLDVDGPLNPFAGMPDRRPTGFQTYRLMPPSWEAAELARLKVWGRPGQRPIPLPLWLDPDHGRALSALPYQLAWATTWEAEANDYIAPILGLPALPFIAWVSPRTRLGGGMCWKTPQVVDWVDGRPFAWLDDEIGEADQAWVADHHAGPALLHRIDPQLGLQADDLALLAAWARNLGRTTGEPRDGGQP